MFSYSNSAFVEAEANYRRERLVHDWSPSRAGEQDGLLAARRHLSMRPGRTLRGMLGRYRHA
jgi:hypothetical protein